MKALSIRQPWAWAILRADKRIENREWHTGAYRTIARAMIGRSFVLHASASPANRNGVRYDDCKRFVEWLTGLDVPDYADMPRGAIVGRCRLADLVLIDNTADPWAVPGAVGLVLADVEAIDEPIPYKGALGFFEVPDAVLAGATWTAAPRG